MSAPPVTAQEIAVHVFAVRDSPAADTAIRAIWSRCAELLGATEPITATGLPAEPPAVIPAAPPGGSLPLAARRDPHGRVEALLRREHELLNLSVLVSERAELPWTAADSRLDAVLGDTGPLLGVERLYLGKAAAGQDRVPATPQHGRDLSDLLPPGTYRPRWWHDGAATQDGLALWEVTPQVDERVERRFVVLARPDRDQALSAWTWSAAGSAAMPAFARYLMHLAKVRYQLRVWSTQPPAQRYSRLQTTLHHPLARTELALATLDTRLIRQTVQASWTNATAALNGNGPDLDGAGAGPFGQDRALVEWFVQQLDQNETYLAAFDEGARVIHETAAVPQRTEGAQRPGTPAPRADATGVPAEGTTAPGADPREPSPPPSPAAGPVTGASGARPRQVLVLADEWWPARGGLSALNRYLCVALARAGARVYCVVPAYSVAEEKDATAAGVTLIDAPPIRGAGRLDGLMSRPRLPAGVVPDVVVGHSRFTGPHAKSLCQNHFPRAVRLHFVHMAPKDTEWWKEDRQIDTAEVSEERGRIELELGEGAGRVVAIGPRLYEWLERLLPVDDGIAEPLRLDPGFDVPGQDTAAEPARTPAVPRGVPQILLLGRLEDALIKGLDIAAKAIGDALRLGTVEDGRVELLLRGAPAGQAGDVRQKIIEWSGRPSLGAEVWNFTTEPHLLRQDLRRSSLLLMPSRAEGFGLVGLEAIAAGCPVLVSGHSGLGMLLAELLPSELARRVVVPVRNDEQDVPRWSAMIAAVLANREAAFATAADVRRVMAERRTWAMAAATLLAAVDEAAAVPR